MSRPQERILLVEDDPDVSDLIARQTLKPLGYQVKVVGDAPRAIQEAIKLVPDVVIMNINMPGLSGKDLLVALSSQGLNMPVIVVAEEGMETDVIQAFRLGASDYLNWPIRETEVVAAVERALEQVRARYERERLARKLESTNRELQNRVRELTTIFGIGKAVTSITDPKALFDKIIDGAVNVAQAEKGWLLLRKRKSKTFVLSALRNLPKSIALKIDQPWDDGISSLVALSGETLSIHGAPLKRFKVSRLGEAALVVPVKAQKEVVGLMVVLREAARPFSDSHQTLLEALADYASISLVNARLFQALEERARSHQKSAEISKENEHIRIEFLQNIHQKLKSPLNTIDKQIDIFLRNGKNLNSTQRDALQAIAEEINRTKEVIRVLEMMKKATASRTMVTVDLIDLARQSVTRFLEPAQQNSVEVKTEFSPEPVLVLADFAQLAQVFDILLSNAVQHCPGGEVFLQVEKNNSGLPHVIVKDDGPGIAKEHQAHIFHPFFKIDSAEDETQGMGMGLALAKEIIKAHNGEIWVESPLGSGSTFHFTLRAMN